MQTRGHAVLKGPADAGKTSCLQLGGDLAEKEGYQVYYYSGHCISRGITLNTSSICTSKTTKSMRRLSLGQSSRQGWVRHFDIFQFSQQYYACQTALEAVRTTSCPSESFGTAEGLTSILLPLLPLCCNGSPGIVGVKVASITWKMRLFMSGCA